MSNLDNAAVSTHLGKSSEYKSQYDKSLLVREPRANNRKYLEIEDDKLPFNGVDVWNGYEVSALTYRGVPVTAIAKVVYPADSKYIVESKSMKLYWNSYNMTKCGYNITNVLTYLKTIAARDLSELLETTVTVELFDSACNKAHLEEDLFNYAKNENIFNIDHLADLIECTEYTENEEILEAEYRDNQLVQPGTFEMYHSALLKSNCRVTAQPDFGDLYVYMQGQSYPTKESLLQYIVSFRDECHFHEEIVECIFQRLNTVFNPDLLIVCAKYTRRGGWDIVPLRYKLPIITDDNEKDFKDIEELVESLADFESPKVKLHKTPRQ